MKKIALLTLTSALFVSSAPITASAAGIQLKINGKAVVFSDAKPYKNGSTAMIPLRQAAQALDLKVGFDSAANKATIERQDLKITVTPGSDQAVDADGKTIAIGAKAVAKHNRIYVPLSFFEHTLGLSAVYDGAEAVIMAAQNHDDTARKIADLLASAAYQRLSDLYFDESLKQAVSADALKAGWEQIVSAAGDYIGVESIATNPQAAEQTDVTFEFSKAKAVLSLSFNASNQVISLWLKPVHAASPIPDDLVEEEVVLGEGSAYPLPGTLTLPKNANGPLTAVVLVHGSGPNDRDETVGAAKPFRDIAWGLAEQGIAVLRYDKRTLVYGKSFTPDTLAKFTVKDETVDDAIAAAKLLKSDKRIDASKVYIAGHSLGGMLAPRIDADGGDFAGLILLAGSTRTLWEIIADQNADFIAAMDDQDPKKKANEEWLAAELERARNISNLTDLQAQTQTVFGVPAYYFKEMDSRSAADLASEVTKPILVMQGGADVQVYANKDYPLLQSQLKSNSKASFKLYDGLNHFFVNPAAPTAKVDDQVVQDMADWLKKN